MRLGAAKTANADSASQDKAMQASSKPRFAKETADANGSAHRPETLAIVNKTKAQWTAWDGVQCIGNQIDTSRCFRSAIATASRIPE